MNKKLRRLLLLALSLITVLSAVGIPASAETYTVDQTYTSMNRDVTLPTLTNPALAWEGPEALYTFPACGKEEHTHGIETCSYREVKEGEESDFGMVLYYIRKDDPDHPGEYIWVPGTLEDFNNAKCARGVYTYFVWTCTKEEHTHTDACNRFDGYQWTVRATNRNEHEIGDHIRVSFTGAQPAEVSNVTVAISYANGDAVTLTKYDHTDDYGALIYKDIHNSQTGYAFISNDTDDSNQRHITGVTIGFTYNGASYTYNADTFSALEAARLACSQNQWAKNGLDFTIQVASASKYYYKIVKNYLLNDTTVNSQTAGDENDTVETGLSKVTVTPESTSTYNGETYSLDKIGSNDTDVDLSASMNDSSKAVVLNLNYRRYSVSYEFASGTNGKNLPESVLSQLPENASLPMGSTAYPEKDTFNPIYEYINGTTVGTWTFNGWDKDSVSNVAAPVTFTGTWTYTESEIPEEFYSVTCTFVSGTEGKDLPEGVTNQLPESITLPVGTEMPDEFTFEPVAERNASGNPVGTWRLESWVKTADGKNITYTGTWIYTAAKTYSVTYAWATGSPVPKDAALPTDSNAYCVGDPVTVAATPITASTENNSVQGTWKFLGWDTTSFLPNGKMAAPDDGSDTITIYGAWRFTEASKHSYTLTYFGNGGVYGEEEKTAFTDSESRENVTDTSLEVTVDRNMFAYDRYEFQGWAESLEAAAAGSITVKPEDKITLTSEYSSKALYAVWKQVDFSITVDNFSTGYGFKDGDTLSFNVTVNGESKGTYTLRYSAANGWTGFTIENLKKDNVVTVTELSPAKSGYRLNVTNASGATVATNGGSYAQTLTVADGDTSLCFMNNYTVKSEEEKPAEILPVNPLFPTDGSTATAPDESVTPVLPATGDGETAFLLPAALLLTGAMIAFVTVKKKETKKAK